MRQKQPRKRVNQLLSHPMKELRASFASKDRTEKGRLPQWVSANYSSGLSIKDEARLSAQRIIEKAQAALVASRQLLLTVGEAAAYLRIFQKTVRPMIEAGNLAVILIARSVSIHPEGIKRLCVRESRAVRLSARE